MHLKTENKDDCSLIYGAGVHPSLQHHALFCMPHGKARLALYNYGRKLLEDRTNNSLVQCCVHDVDRSLAQCKSGDPQIQFYKYSTAGVNNLRN